MSLETKEKDNEIDITGLQNEKEIGEKELGRQTYAFQKGCLPCCLWNEQSYKPENTLSFEVHLVCTFIGNQVFEQLTQETKEVHKASLWSFFLALPSSRLETLQDIKYTSRGHEAEGLYRS